MTQYLQASTFVKVRCPSSLTKNYWAVEEKTSKTTFAMPFLAIMMIMACAKPITKNALFTYLSNKLPTNLEKMEKTLEELRAKKIILFSNECSELNSEIEQWKKAGWEEAADYHFFTWDAPFLDYSKEGRGHEYDRNNMVQYQLAQPDTQRVKIYDKLIEKTKLPIFSDDMAPATIIDNLSLTEKVKILLSLAFGKWGKKPCHWSDVPLIRRTSPSGGSRHPTEGYFLSFMEDIAKGWYHIQTEPPSLNCLSLILRDKPEELPFFATEGHSNLGAIILTSVFERNMYRYREPRTFRTIHMDVGHLIETIEWLAKELDFKTKLHLTFDEKEILAKIDASKFDEGVMAIVTLQEVT
jgi:SagB-type dehydrogenase family enzyme